MLYNTLNIGRTGLNAMQNNLDATSHNIANVDTVGYKKQINSFEELLVDRINDREVILGPEAQNTGINVGSRSGIGKTDYRQGALFNTGVRTHLAIEGDGLFGLRDNNNLILTRTGEFHLNKDNTISDNNGYLLDIDYDDFEISTDYDEDEQNLDLDDIIIDNKGTIFIKSNEEDDEDGYNFSSDLSFWDDEEDYEELRGYVKMGTINLYYPESNKGLRSIDGNSFLVEAGVNLYTSSENPEYFGNIHQGYLERSNVDLAQSMVDLITTQKAYSMNARCITTTDEIIKMVNNFKR